MSQIPTEIIYPVIAISMGLLGSVTRIFVQYLRDKQLPADGLSLYAEAFIGCVAGLITYLKSGTSNPLNDLALISIGAGYLGSDIIEAIVNGTNS